MFDRFYASALAMLAVVGLAAVAQADPVGAEFVVNTVTNGREIDPQIAALRDNGFVVTWTTPTTFSNSDNRARIDGRLFDADGAPVGDQFILNPQQSIEEGDTETSVAGLDDSGFVVTWTKKAGDGNGSAVFGQRFSKTGARVGSDFRVNTHTQDHQSRSQVVKLSNGGFVVIWNASYGQIYNASGGRVGDELLVASPHGCPGLVAIPGGGFLITNAVSVENGSRLDLYAKRYSNAGVLLGPKFKIDDFVICNAGVALTPLKGGGFVVFWVTSEDETFIRGQRYDDAAKPVGSRFTVTHLEAHFREGGVSASAMSDGGFLVTWLTHPWLTPPFNGGTRGKLFAQRYSAAATTVGDPFQVNPVDPERQPQRAQPQSARLKNGGFVIIWRDTVPPTCENNSCPTDIRGQLFGP